MSIWACPTPAIPEHWELKDQFEKEIYPATLRGWAQFFMGLASLEEINLEELLAGNIAPSRHSLEVAQMSFQKSRECLTEAYETCLELRTQLPTDVQNMLTPTLQIYNTEITLLREAEIALERDEVPTLETIHTISALIREDLVFGERMAKVNRGRKGHFAYPEDAFAETKLTVVS